MVGKPAPGRREDEVLLAKLALICALGPVKAAPLMGISAPYASVLRQRVMADDVAESVPHEALRDVRGAYGMIGGRG